DLIYSEFLLREELGEHPTCAEYEQRFPAFRDALRRQFKLHEAWLQSWELDATQIHERSPDRSDSPPTLSSFRHDTSAELRLFPEVPGYEILDELGRGGMGVVYLARQIGLNRLVALKMIRSGVQASPEELERFVGEAEAVARLSHPNLIQIHAIGTWQGLPYFCLEYVSGGSLEHQLDHQPQDPRTAAALLETLARAIHHAHERGVVHRDLKPANVLLRKPEARTGQIETKTEGPAAGGLRLTDFTPKITDFGLAKQLGLDAGQTDDGALLG